MRGGAKLAVTLRDQFELALLFRRIATVEVDAPTIDLGRRAASGRARGPSWSAFVRGARGARPASTRAVKLAERRG